MREVHVWRSSVVEAAPARVWDVVTTCDGANDELMPYVRMREPRRLRGRTLESYRPGERAACWLLAWGWLPFDRHVLGLESITPGTGFVEESHTLLQRRWRHERTIEPAGSGTRISDHVTILPRLPGTGPAIRRTVRIIFAHRHRRLARRFGSVRGR